MDNDVLLEHLIASSVWWDASVAARDRRITPEQFAETTDWANRADEVHCFQTVADSYPEQWVW